MISNDDFEAAYAYSKGFAAVRTLFVTSAVAAQGYQFPPGSPSVAGAASAAAAAVTPAAAGGVARVYGANFGGADTTTVYFNGYAAPVLFASPGQFNVEVPWETAGANSMIGVIVNGKPRRPPRIPQ